MDQAERRRTEQVAITPRSNAQPVREVLLALLTRQGSETPAHPDAFAELSKPGRLQHGVELGLAQHQDLQELGALSLEVRE